MGRSEQRRVREALGQGQGLLAVLPRRLVLPTGIIQLPQSRQHREQAGGVPQLLAQRVSLT